MQFRIQDGMDVFAVDGRKVGEVRKALVTTEPLRTGRFFVLERGFLLVREHLVPYEAVTRAGRHHLHLSLGRQEVKGLPRYEGRPPTEEEARRAWRCVGERASARPHPSLRG